MGRFWKERRITRMRREHVETARGGATAIAERRTREPSQPAGRKPGRAALRLEFAKLGRADLSGANLSRCRLDRATLDGANLTGADLTEAVLRHASLRHANLSEVCGLTPAQLAGCDLTGAVLPESIDVKELAAAAHLGEAAGYTRHLFLWMIGSCAFCAATIAAMPMRQLLMSGGQVKLPVLGVAAPTFVFFCAAPAILLAVFFYFHLSLQRLWEKLALLPAIYPDGEPLDRKTHGWLMFGLVRRHLPQLRERPAMFRMQSLVHVLIAYGVVPLSILFIWWRYSLRHDWNRSILHAMGVAISLFLAIGFYAIATGTLRGKKRRVLLWSRYGAAVAALFGLQHVMEESFLGHGFQGFNVTAIDESFSERPTGWRAQRVELDEKYLATIRSPRRRAGFIAAKPGEPASNSVVDYVESYEKAYAPIKGASLAGVNLVNGKLGTCFLAHADLAFAQWHRIECWNVDLSYAILNNAVIEDAMFMESWLVGASFVDASLSHAKFHGVMAMQADFRGGFLYGVEATHADFRGAQFDRASLFEAQLATALLDGASFNQAKACRVDFGRASIDGAAFIGADLRGASFAGAQLANCDFTDAKIGVETSSDGEPNGPPTNFCGADLSLCRGLTHEQLELASTDGATQLPAYLLDLPRRDSPAVVVLPKLPLDVPSIAAAGLPGTRSTADERIGPTVDAADESFNPLRPGLLRR